MYLQLFVSELQQNKKICTWEIKWISNVVRIWTSNANNSLIFLSDNIDIDFYYFLTIIVKIY